jgi:Na+-driven multidrug efflux pump
VMLIPGRLGFAYLMRPFWGADAIWWSFPVSYVLAGVLIVGYYRHGGWRDLNVIAQTHSELSTHRQPGEQSHVTH